MQSLRWIKWGVVGGRGARSSPRKTSGAHLSRHKVILQVIRGNYSMSLRRDAPKYISVGTCKLSSSARRGKRKYYRTSCGFSLGPNPPPQPGPGPEPAQRLEHVSFTTQPTLIPSLIATLLSWLSSLFIDLSF